MQEPKEPKAPLFTSLRERIAERELNRGESENMGLLELLVPVTLGTTRSRRVEQTVNRKRQSQCTNIPGS